MLVLQINTLMMGTFSNIFITIGLQYCINSLLNRVILKHILNYLVPQTHYIPAYMHKKHTIHSITFVVSFKYDAMD
jgi:hypothetical protein